MKSLYLLICQKWSYVYFTHIKIPSPLVLNSYLKFDQTESNADKRWILDILYTKGKPFLLWAIRICFKQTFIIATGYMSRNITKQTMLLWAQRRLRSAWASTQSDQSLHCPHEESLGPKLPIERTAKTLIRLGGCPGWSESWLGA